MITAIVSIIPSRKYQTNSTKLERLLIADSQEENLLCIHTIHNTQNTNIHFLRDRVAAQAVFVKFHLNFILIILKYVWCAPFGVSTILLFRGERLLFRVFVRSFNSIMASCTTNDGNNNNNNNNEKNQKKDRKNKEREREIHVSFFNSLTIKLLKWNKNT